MVKTNKSFTLAEVLITLVIIGIIAAITVPVLMANHKRTEYSARLKKIYSTMNNALRLAETEQGIPAYEWDFSGSDTQEIFDKYFSNYVTCVSKTPVYEEILSSAQSAWLIDEGGSSGVKACFLNDGTFIFSPVAYSGSGSTPSNYMIFVVDINGLSKPNREGQDQFWFAIGAYGGSDSIDENKCNGFTPITADGCGTDSQTYTRDVALSQCKTYSLSCAYLLMMDSWEFKEDYPWRL